MSKFYVMDTNGKIVWFDSKGDREFYLDNHPQARVVTAKERYNFINRLKSNQKREKTQ